MTDRDEALGAALRELETPEHLPGFETELRRRLPGRRPRRRIAARLALVAAAAAAAIAAASLVHSGGGTASAATVQRRLDDALRTMRNLSAELVVSGPAEPVVRRWEFTLDAKGDVRLAGPRPGDVETYDAAHAVVRSAQHSASLGGSTIFYAERRGVAPGPPDQGPPTWILPTEYAAYVRAGIEAGDPRVQDVTYAGRPAWRLDVPGRFRITVDKANGMPVRVEELRGGRVARVLRLEHVAVDRKIAARTFRLAFPKDAEVMRSDDGFRPARVSARPGWVPDGYRLAQSMRSGSIVSLAYRRGLDVLVVTTRPARPGDPFANVPNKLPHYSARRGGRLVTVAGGASHAELIRVAASVPAG